MFRPPRPHPVVHPGLLPHHSPCQDVCPHGGDQGAGQGRTAGMPGALEVGHEAENPTHLWDKRAVKWRKKGNFKTLLLCFSSCPRHSGDGHELY